MTTSKAGKIQAPLHVFCVPQSSRVSEVPRAQGLPPKLAKYKRPSMFSVFPRAPGSQKYPEPKGYLQSWQNTSAPPCFLCSLEPQGLKSTQSPRSTSKAGKIQATLHVFTCSLEPQGHRSTYSPRDTSKAGKILAPLHVFCVPQSPRVSEVPSAQGAFQSWQNTSDHSCFLSVPQSPRALEVPRSQGILQSWQNTSALPPFLCSLEPQGLRSPQNPRDTSKAGKIQAPLHVFCVPQSPRVTEVHRAQGLPPKLAKYNHPSMFSVFPRAPGSQKSPEPKGYLQSWQNTSAPPYFYVPQSPRVSDDSRAQGLLPKLAKSSAPQCFLCSLELQGLRSPQGLPPEPAEYFMRDISRGRGYRDLDLKQKLTLNIQLPPPPIQHRIARFSEVCTYILHLVLYRMYQIHTMMLIKKKIRFN